MRHAWLILVPVLILARGVGASGRPDLASYSADAHRMFWFVHVTDIHIGSGDTADDNLELVVNEGRQVFAPWFFLATGDLVEDGRSGEWQRYRSIITDAGLDAGTWWDLPGNHDNNLDGDDFEPGFIDDYLAYSLSGAVHSNWLLDTDFGRYQIVGVYTDHDADRLIPSTELDFVTDSLVGAPEARLAFVGGHHPLEGLESADPAGCQALEGLMQDHGVSLYAFGHVHTLSELLLPHNYSALGYLRWVSRTLGKPEPVISPAGLSVFAVDNDSLSGRTIEIFNPPIGPAAFVLPAALVTAPADWGDDNPYAYPVSRSSVNNPVRALIFSVADPDEVRFRLEDGSWQGMQPAGGSLWTGAFEGAGLPHALWLEVEVRVGMRSDRHRIDVQVVDLGACEDGIDNDADGVADYPDDPGCSAGFDSDEREPHGVPPVGGWEDGGPIADGGGDGFVGGDNVGVGDAFGGGDLFAGGDGLNPGDRTEGVVVTGDEGSSGRGDPGRGPANPGGCGCRGAGADGSPSPSPLLMLLLLVGLRLRQRS